MSDLVQIGHINGYKYKRISILKFINIWYHIIDRFENVEGFAGFKFSKFAIGEYILEFSEYQEKTTHKIKYHDCIVLPLR